MGLKEKSQSNSTNSLTIFESINKFKEDLQQQVDNYKLLIKDLDPDFSIFHEYSKYIRTNQLHIPYKTEGKHSILDVSLLNRKRKIINLDSKVIDFWLTTKHFIIDEEYDDPLLFDPKVIIKIPQVLTKFLNTLINLDFLFNYKQDLIHGIKFCETVVKEKLLRDEMLKYVPGAFNISMCLKFGGSFYGCFDYFLKNYGNQVDPMIGLKRMEISIGVSVKEAESFSKKFIQNNVSLKYSIRGSFQIKEITTLPKEFDDIALGYSRLSLVPFHNEKLKDGISKILEYNEVPSPPINLQAKIKRWPQLIDIVVPNQLDNNCLLGTVISSDFHLLSCGLWYMDTIRNIYCPYEFSENLILIQ